MAEPTQYTDYYPFGLAHTTHTPGFTPTSTNRYLYNGKLLQHDAYDTNSDGQPDYQLNLYDYGARFYDPAVGRWYSVDPLVEKYESYSPYHFSGNNPILFIDSNGMDWYNYTDADGNIHYKYQEGSEKTIKVGDNTYSNIGVSVNIQLGEGYYYNDFQNYGLTSIDGPIDVKQRILESNTLQDKLLSKNSGFSKLGQTEIISSLIHYSQSDFLKTSAVLSGEILDNVGTGITMLGYGTALLGAEPIAIGLIGLGNGMSLIGGGIQSSVYLKSGDYYNLAFELGTNLIGFGIGNKINNATKLSANDKMILRTGAELKLELFQWLGLMVKEKKK